jgi:hypothetical protein
LEGLCQPSGFAVPAHRSATVFVDVFKVHSPFLAKLKLFILPKREQDKERPGPGESDGKVHHHGMNGVCFRECSDQTVEKVHGFFNSPRQIVP